MVVRSTAGDPLEVQARQSPFGTSRTVSVNTAVGFRLGDQASSLTLVDGVTAGPPRRQAGRAAARARRRCRAAAGWSGATPTSAPPTATTCAGRTAPRPRSTRSAPYGYRLLVRLAPGRAGKVQGLLGNFDGDPTNDIAPPTGAALTQPVPFDKLYPSYADSWRITQNDVAVHLRAAARAPQTFTDRTSPSAVQCRDLDAARRAQAEEVCRWAGMTDPGSSPSASSTSP